MTKTLHFTVSIEAPRHVVWDTLTGDESYQAWTAAFCEGSHYRGSWDEGSKIQFLAPGGDVVLPTEGGHSTFAPVDEQEREINRLLLTRFERFALLVIVLRGRHSG